MATLSIGSGKRALTACTVAALLAIPTLAAPQDLTTLLTIFLRNLRAGQIVVPVSTLFASLPSATNGTIVYCSDCTEATTPCTGSGSGSFALRQGSQWVCPDGGAGGGAPADAEYWVGAANATLSAEKNLGALSTGLVLNTAGVPSAYGGIDCTNQFPRDISGSGVGTCASVSLANDITGTLGIANGGTGQTAATAAFNGLDPLTTRGDLLTHNGTDSIRLAMGAAYTGPVSDGSDLVYRPVEFLPTFVGAGGFTTSSTTYVDVTGMTVALPANMLFAFDCFGTFTTSDNAAGTTNGIGFSINGTGGTSQAAEYTIWWQTVATNTSGNNTGSTAPFTIRNENTFNSMTAITSVISVANSLRWLMKGFYYTGTSGTSTFAMRVRSENGTPQSATIQVGSYCKFNRQIS